MYNSFYDLFNLSKFESKRRRDLFEDKSSFQSYLDFSLQHIDTLSEKIYNSVNGGESKKIITEKDDFLKKNYNNNNISPNSDYKKFDNIFIQNNLENQHHLIPNNNIFNKINKKLASSTVRAFSDSNIVNFLFKQQQLDKFVIISLSNLIRASKEEDTTSTVVNSDSLKLFLDSASRLYEMCCHLDSILKDSKHSKLSSSLLSVLTFSIYNVLTPFYQNLQHLSFHPKTLHLLKPFINYQV